MPREIQIQLTSTRVPVWDAGVRIVHWALVLLIPAAWWTIENHQLGRHKLIGYTIAGLLIFRLLWGLFGSPSARFATFVRGPRTVLAYLRGQGAEAPPGHTPLGALSVVAILALLIGHVSTGLFAVDTDGLESGPFAHFVSFDQGRWAARAHGVTFNLIVAMTALHVGAILFYALRGRPLVGAMLRGWRSWGDPAAAARFAPWWRGVMLAVLSAVLVWGALRLWGQDV
ncbi:MAG: cytochrome b/b6 domain-containing protein [Sphingomonadaceae bacterium]|nr:cytochrome b/b6 domain-containing protein [Sphingomonadaceae bacterium]